MTPLAPGMLSRRSVIVQAGWACRLPAWPCPDERCGASPDRLAARRSGIRALTLPLAEPASALVPTRPSKNLRHELGEACGERRCCPESGCRDLSIMHLAALLSCRSTGGTTVARSSADLGWGASSLSVSRQQKRRLLSAACTWTVETMRAALSRRTVPMDVRCLAAEPVWPRNGAILRSWGQPGLPACAMVVTERRVSETTNARMPRAARPLTRIAFPTSAEGLPARASGPTEDPVVS